MMRKRILVVMVVLAMVLSVSVSVSAEEKARATVPAEESFSGCYLGAGTNFDEEDNFDFDDEEDFYDDYDYEDYDDDEEDFYDDNPDDDEWGEAHWIFNYGVHHYDVGVSDPTVPSRDYKTLSENQAI